MLESMGVVLEVVIDAPHEGFITARRRLLLLFGPVFDRRFRGKRLVDALLDPFAPSDRRGAMEWFPCPHGVDPFAGHRSGIEDRELCPVVLETFPFFAAPDGDEVVCGIGLYAGHGQAPKDDVPPLLGLGKHQEKWDFDSLVWRVVQAGEA